MRYSGFLAFVIQILFIQMITVSSAAEDTEIEPTTCRNDDKKIKIRDLWSKGPNDATEFLSGIYEHSSWVAEALLRTESYHEITTVSDLAKAMQSIVDDASEEQKLTLLKAHPDLAQKVEKLEELTQESQEEQSSAGLQSMTDDELQTFTSLNEEYKSKFQFPFILAVRTSTKYTVLSALNGRVDNPPEVEFVTALQQVHKIGWMRILSKLESDDPQGYLTCHVLDTANGCPAANMRISLWKIHTNDSNDRELVANFVTNDDGRLASGPALKGTDFQVGTYEWIFYTGDYFASKGTYVSGTPFVDEIPLRFGIDNPDDHYHVPLLVSPWSYSTYRGS